MNVRIGLALIVLLLVPSTANAKCYVIDGRVTCIQTLSEAIAEQLADNDRYKETLKEEAAVAEKAKRAAEIETDERMAAKIRERAEGSKILCVDGPVSVTGRHFTLECSSERGTK